MKFYIQIVAFMAIILSLSFLFRGGKEDIDLAEAASFQDVLDGCEGTPTVINSDLENRPQDFGFGSQPRWDGENGQINSVVVMMDSDRCSSGHCLSHFFLVRGGMCEYTFSSTLESDTPLSLSIVQPADLNHNLTDTMMDDCQVIFMGFCY